MIYLIYKDGVNKHLFYQGSCAADFENIFDDNNHVLYLCFLRQGPVFVLNNTDTEMTMTKRAKMTEVSG